MRPIHDKNLIWQLTAIGVLLAIWIIFMQKGRINVDAVFYLEIARRFAEGDTQGALALYNWPLLPWLMAQIHHLTGLSVQYAAHLMAILFFGVTTWSFLTLIREADGNHTAVLSGAVLLFSAPYIVGDILPMVMRDQGFWAFHLLSLLFFTRFYRNSRLSDAVLWQMSAVLATLFRVEAVSFIILLPLALAFREQSEWKARLALLVKAYILPLVGVISLICAFLFLPGLEIQHKLGRLVDIQNSLLISYHQITGGLAEKAQIYGTAVLGKFMAEYAMLGLLLTLSAVLMLTIVGASNWLGVALALASRSDQAMMPANDTKTVLYWASGVNLLNLVVILLTAFLLTGRYAIGMAFIILFFASFSLAGFYESWRKGAASTPGRKLIYLGIAIVIGFYLLKNLTHHEDYYEQEAVSWVKQHASSRARIFYDSARLRYYGQAPWGGRDEDWKDLFAAMQSNPVPFDYLVLHIKHRHPERLEILEKMQQYRTVHEVKAANGDRILIMASQRQLNITNLVPSDTATQRY